MRTWHITKTLMGGAGQYALRLSRALRTAGVDSAVLVPTGPVTEDAVQLARQDGPLLRFLARAQRSLIRRMSVRTYHSLHGLETYRPPHPMQPPDIVHLHGMPGWIGVRGLRRLIPASARVFQTTHGPWDVSGGCGILAGWTCQAFRAECQDCPALRAPFRRLARLELRAKRRFVEEFSIQPIANSTWMAVRIAESFVYSGEGSPPIVLPIVADAYLEPEIPDLREQLKIPPGNAVISLGARSITDSLKGISDFLANFARRPGLAARVTILVFGEGRIPLPGGLDVRLLGNILKHTELASIYRTSALFVSPSMMESFGMTLAEAQATGTPIVAFDVGGIREAVCPALHEHLVPAGNWTQLISMIDKCLRERGKSCAGAALRGWATSAFSASEVAQKQIAVYQSSRFCPR